MSRYLSKLLLSTLGLSLVIVPGIDRAHAAKRGRKRVDHRSGAVWAKYKKKFQTAYGKKLRSNVAFRSAFPHMTKMKRFRGTKDLKPVSGHFDMVGDQAKRFVWGREEDEIFVHMVINAADSGGVWIDNLKPGDKISVTTATGIASFADAKKQKETISSFITAAGDFSGELVPAHRELIAAGGRLAAEIIGLTLSSKKRDAFGQKAGSSKFAQQEGGVLVCMPLAAGIYTSGKRSNWGFSEGKRWIKTEGPRLNSKRPKHVKHGFFLVRPEAPNEREKRKQMTDVVVRQAGPVILVAWDYKFSDNKGFYEVRLHIKKRKSNDGVEILSKPGAGRRNIGRSVRRLKSLRKRRIRRRRRK